MLASQSDFTRCGVYEVRAKIARVRLIIKMAGPRTVQLQEDLAKKSLDVLDERQGRKRKRMMEAVEKAAE